MEARSSVLGPVTQKATAEEPGMDAVGGKEREYDSWFQKGHVNSVKTTVPKDFQSRWWSR